MTKAEIFAGKYFDNFKKFQKDQDSFGHSAIAFVRKDGEWYGQKDGACYSAFTYNKNPMDAAAVYVNWPKFSKKTYKLRSYLSWLLTKSPFKQGFLTKSVKDGIENGFFLNLKCDAAMTRGAMMAFRTALEEPNWSWGRYKDLGFDPVESFALATTWNVNMSKGTCGYNSFNSNHKVIMPKSEFKFFTGEMFKPCGSSYEEGSKNTSTTPWWCGYEGGYLQKFEVLEGLPNKGEFTKFFCEDALKQMKGE